MNSSEFSFTRPPSDQLSPAFPGRAPWGTAGKLRAWQEEAIKHYFDNPSDIFTLTATPGAGKTTFALRLVRELFDRQVCGFMVVVAPTEHLKFQWADAATRMGIKLNPRFSNTKENNLRSFQGIVVTYAQVASQPWRLKQLVERYSTAAIFDEIHHAGDQLSWGSALQEAFEFVTRKILLTGTPFRSDNNQIPFVAYSHNGSELISQSDYRYGYQHALQDGVVRPVIFLSYAGKMRWRNRSGDSQEAELGHKDTKDIVSQAWRTALDPTGEWIVQVFEAANRRLTEVRHHIPDAGGLIIASNQSTARAYAKLMASIAGEDPVVVLSDDRGSSDRIMKFNDSNQRWMIAVRMVSEGVDVPRLLVGVYATNASTPLYFTQAVGRFVRARRRGEVASIFIPSVTPLLALAAEIEAERDHVLATSAGQDFLLDELLEKPEREVDTGELIEYDYAAISAKAIFAQAMYAGESFGSFAAPATAEEEEFIGLPGILDPEQIRDLLIQRQLRQARRRALTRVITGQQDEEIPVYRTLKEQRQLLKTLVNRWSKLSGSPQSHIYNDLRDACGGPVVSAASTSQLQRRVDLISKWLTRS